MKTKLLNKLSAKRLKLARDIGRLAEGHQYSAYLVGGIVRDLLLGKKNLDLDIVIEGDGIEFAQKLASRINSRLICHKQFGTATLHLADHSKIDIATARKETYAFPGALPEVTPGTIKDDLLRRDFSINTMAIQLNPSHLGELIDFYHGEEDLKNKQIRVLHDLSFVDDPTRILRAIRFKERFGFRWETNTQRLLKEAINQRVFTTIKGPRLFAEAVRLLKEPSPKKYILSVNNWCKWDFISPGIKIDKKVIRTLSSVERQIDWFENKFPPKRKLETWLIYFMTLVDELGIRGKEKLLERFNLKADDRKCIRICARQSTILASLAKKIISPSEVYKILRLLSDEAVLFLKAKNSSPLINRRIEYFLLRSDATGIAINGSDLKRMGLKESRKIGKTLLKILQAKLDGKVTSRKEEFVLAQKIIKGK